MANWNGNGDAPRQHKNDPEHQAQVAFFERVHWAAQWHPELEAIYAVPNAAQRSEREGARMKDEGLKPGQPDVCVPIPRNGYGALYLELKVGKNKPTPEQVARMKVLESVGNLCLCVWGWEAMWEAVVEYMDIPLEHASDLIDLALRKQQNGA